MRASSEHFGPKQFIAFQSIGGFFCTFICSFLVGFVCIRLCGGWPFLVSQLCINALMFMGTETCRACTMPPLLGYP